MAAAPGSLDGGGVDLEEVAPFLRTSSEFGSPEASLSGNSTSDQVPSSVQTTSITRRLCVSHFLSTWNSRVFEFGAVLFLAKLFPGTLLPSSVYALFRAASAICLSPAVGNFIDRGERLVVVRRSILGQRIAVIISCMLFQGLTLHAPQWEGLRVLCFACACFLAVVEKQCSVMNLIAIERDWVVVIAEETQTPLEVLNSQMRRIDLFSKLLGPLFIAFVDSISTRVAIYAVFGMGLMSVYFEYFAIARVYHKVAALQSPRTSLVTQDVNNSDHLPTRSWSRQRAKQCFTSVLQYIHHPMFLPSISLSVLYFTVLSFSGQMVTYLVSVDFTSLQIGLMRTAAVILELSATWLAPLIIIRIGPIRSGLWSVNWQLLCLVPTVSLFAVIKAPYMAALVMVVGVVLSRVGLWGFDLSVQLLVQEAIEPEARGSFSSMETSAQNVFELCAYLSTIIFSRPDQFRYPILMSAAAILVADALYAKYVVDSRGHLIHISKCMVGPGASTRWNLKRRTDIRTQDLP